MSDAFIFRPALHTSRPLGTSQVLVTITAGDDKTRLRQPSLRRYLTISDQFLGFTHDSGKVAVNPLRLRVCLKSIPCAVRARNPASFAATLRAPANNNSLSHLATYPDRSAGHDTKRAAERRLGQPRRAMRRETGNVPCLGGSRSQPCRAGRSEPSCPWGSVRSGHRLRRGHRLRHRDDSRGPAHGRGGPGAAGGRLEQ